MKLYTYENNRLTAAPTFVTIDGVPYSQPTQATLRRAGIMAYPLAADPAPTPPEGKVAVPTGYEVRDGAWHRTYRYDDAPAPAPKVYDKYRLVDALINEGVWNNVEAYLKLTPNAWTRMLMAPDISADEPLLADGIAAVKQLLGWTDEQVAAVLAQAEIGGA